MTKRTRSILQLAGLALVGVFALGAGCPLVPKIEERVVELAVGSSTIAHFDTQGDLDVHDDVVAVDLRNDLDLRGILDGAGVDLADVENIKISGVSYRTTRPDPVAARAIANGNVTVQRGAGTAQNLVVGFNQNPVNAATSWTTAPLDPAGVSLLNTVLSDLLVELRDGTPAGNLNLTFHVTGQSTPTGVETDFEYDLRLDLSIVGTVKVDVVN